MKKTNIALAILMALGVQYAHAQPTSAIVKDAIIVANTVQSEAWSKDRIYADETTVTWKGKEYKNAHWTKGNEPGTDGEWGAWKLQEKDLLVVTDPNAVQSGEWSKGQIYADETTVTWEGKTYKNAYWTKGNEPGTGDQWGPWKLQDAEPVVVVEEPTTEIEEPVVVVEEPTAEIDEPVVDVEEPTAEIEEPVVVVEEPTAEIEEPVVDVEEPTAEIEEPVVDVEEPTAEIEEPVVVVEEPTAEIEEPVVDVEEPTAEIEEPVVVVEEPTAEIEEPVVDVEVPVTEVIDPNAIQAKTWTANRIFTVTTPVTVVSWNGNNYTNKWWTQGEEPGKADTAWIPYEGAVIPPDSNVVIDEDGYVPNLKDALATEAKLKNFDLFKKVQESVRTLDNAEVFLVKPGRAENPENVRRFEHLISNETWEYLFPHRHASYTYQNMLQAVAKFPAVCGNYDDPSNPNKADEVCARSMATIFAHFSQETGGHAPSWAVPEWRQGLYYVREAGCESDDPMDCGYNNTCDPTTWQGQTWPCGTMPDGTFKKYYGRGAKQLSYNYNYGPFSQVIFGDTNVLLQNPELVADTWLNLASAMFFFVTPQPPKPSMLHVIDGTWQPNEYDKKTGVIPGFGVTTMIINGGHECGGTVEVAQSENRLNYFKGFSHALNVDIPENEKLGCTKMQAFAEGGAGAILLSWDEDSTWSPDNKDGKTYACKLVKHQTPFNALIPGEYQKCVEAKFKIELKQ
ncbi:glycoside hydrolase family 19 protein [Glaciimonas sp. GG7]